MTRCSTTVAAGLGRQCFIMKRDGARAYFQLRGIKSVNGFLEAVTRIDCIVGIVYYFAKTHGVPGIQPVIII
jgi:hypothetical protein